MHSRDICPLTRYVEEADGSAGRELQDVVMASATFMLWERLYGVVTVSPTLDRLNLYCQQEFQKKKACQKQQQQLQQSSVGSKTTGPFIQRPRSILTDSALFSSNGSEKSNCVPELASLKSDINESNEICDNKDNVKAAVEATELKSINLTPRNAPELSFLEVPRLANLPQLSNVNSLAQRSELFTAQQSTYHTVAEDVTLPFSVDAPHDNERDTFRLSEVLCVDEHEDVLSSGSYRPASRLSGISVSLNAPADPTRLTDTPPPQPEVLTTTASPPGLSLHIGANISRKSSSPRGKSRSKSQPEQSKEPLSHGEDEIQTCGTSLSEALLSQFNSQVPQPEPSLTSSPDTQRSHVGSSPKKQQPVNVSSAECPIRVQPLGIIASEVPRRLGDEDEEASKDRDFGTTELIADTFKAFKEEQTPEKSIKKEEGRTVEEYNSGMDEEEGMCVEDISILSGSRLDVFPDSTSPKRETPSVGHLPKLSIDRGSACISNVSEVQRRSRRYRPPPFYEVAQREITDGTNYTCNIHVPVGESADGLVFSPEQVHSVTTPSMEKGLSLSPTPCVVPADCDTLEPLFARFSNSPVSLDHNAGNAAINETEEPINDNEQGQAEEEEEEGVVAVAEEEGEEGVVAVTEEEGEVSLPQLTPLYNQASEPPISVSPSPSYKDYEWAARAQAALEMQQQRLRARTPPSTSSPSFAPQPSFHVGGFELPHLPKGRHQAGNAEAHEGAQLEPNGESVPPRRKRRKPNTRMAFEQLTPPRGRGRPQKPRVSPALAEPMDRSPLPVAPTPSRTPPVAVSRKRSSAAVGENREKVKRRRRVSPQSNEAGAGAEFLLPQVVKTSSNVQQEKKR